MSQIPQLGSREGTKLEFKRAESLRSKEGRNRIVETIVAMRNSGGGEIWVGAEEVDEALAGWTPLGEADLVHRAALINQITDTTEPVLAVGRDVELPTVEVPGGWVLRARVSKRPEAQSPGCVIKGNARRFLRRLDARNALIPYVELFENRADSPSLRDRVRASHRKWCARFDEPGLALTSLPEDVFGARPRFPSEWRTLIESPPEELARHAGITWYPGEYGQPKVQRDVLKTGRADYRMLNVHSTGELHLYVQARWLDPWSESARLVELSKGRYRGLIEPRALSETVASTVRLAARLWTESRELQSAVAGFVLSVERCEGWAIPLGSRWYRQTLTEHDLSEDRPRWIRLPETTVESDVAVCSVHELAARADAVSYQVLRDVYESDEESAEIGPRDIPWFRDEGVFEVPV